MVSTSSAVTVGVAAAAFLVSIAGVRISIRIARSVGVMDVPNERSSHSVPMPRMGGVPMVVAILAGTIGWAMLSPNTGGIGKELIYTLFFSFGMSLLGFFDDLYGLSPLFRFLFQIGGATMLFWFIAPLFPPVIVLHLQVPSFLFLLAGVTWVVWMGNLYNFMDGIDGLAGGEAVVASTFFAVLFAQSGEPVWAAVNLFVAAAAAGFLVLNWPPADVFMGDAGSTFLGAFYGSQSIAASLTTPVPMVVLLLPFANFILDTTSTLFRRLRGRERWYTAHRGHFYQRMTNLGMSHRIVTLLELASVAVCCAAAALYIHTDIPGRVIVLAAVVVAFLAVETRVARHERRENVR